MAAAPIPKLVEGLQQAGRYSLTRRELESERDRSVEALRAGLRRLGKKGAIVSPRRGFYVIVPLEYRSASAPPPSWWIDDLMRHLGQPYYVGLASAAALWGAAHQQSMVFQVVTDRPTRPVEVGRSKVEFHSRNQIESIPTRDVQTETGTMRVSTPEATAFDLVHFGVGSSLDGPATLLAELVDVLDAGALVAVASQYPTTDAQRLGFLLDLVGADGLSNTLRGYLEGKRVRPIDLVPGRPTESAPTDPDWRVVVNETIEIDV